MKKEYVIIVSQIVKGKSKFPHTSVGSFARYKPWSYSDSNVPHKIVYARSFVDEENKAMEKATQVGKEMFSTYIMGMDNEKLKHTCVSEFTVLIHNITENISKQIMTTAGDNESKSDDFLFPGIKCNNKNLGFWKIIKGLK